MQFDQNRAEESDVNVTSLEGFGRLKGRLVLRRLVSRSANSR